MLVIGFLSYLACCFLIGVGIGALITRLFDR